VFRAWDYVVFLPLTVVVLGTMGTFLVVWFRLARTGYQLIPFFVISVFLLYSFAIFAFRWSMLPVMTRPRRIAAAPGLRVAVATTFVPGLESLAMLEMTVRALVAMRYPHETWVLDEGDGGDVKELCSRLGARHFSRRARPEYLTDYGPFERRTKHGNYNAWFDSVGYDSYDVFVGFDPDHVPDASFLEAALGFLRDPRIGYVQLPQVYYNQRAGFIARGAAEETYAYYSTTQMFSYTAGFPIVTGCHHVHRATALKHVGGFAAHDADDLLITLVYRARGWQGVYLPEIHAKGLTPTDYRSYLSQQHRWARSVLDVKLRAFPRLALSMPLSTRLMSALHGFYYLQEGVLGVLGVCLLVFLLATGVVPAFLSFGLWPELLSIMAVLTVVDLYRQRFFLDLRREAGLHFRAVFLRAAKWPYLLFGLIDAIRGKKRPYSLTSKVKSGRRGLATWPHLVIATLVVSAWLVGFARGVEPPPIVMVFGAWTLLLSLVVVWTETWEAPAPFDPALAKKELGLADAPALRPEPETSPPAP
jgi:hypothetical protein